MATDENLPDWLKELRAQQLGAAGVQPTVPAELSAAADQGAQETQVGSGGDIFDDLRQRASAEPPAEKPKSKVPIIGQLTPFQRFFLALMLFLNVSVVGCLFLIMTEKIVLP